MGTEVIVKAGQRGTARVNCVVKGVCIVCYERYVSVDREV